MTIGNKALLAKSTKLKHLLTTTGISVKRKEKVIDDPAQYVAWVVSVLTSESKELTTKLRVKYTEHFFTYGDPETYDFNETVDRSIYVVDHERFKRVTKQRLSKLR